MTSDLRVLVTGVGSGGLLTEQTLSACVITNPVGRTFETPADVVMNAELLSRGFKDLQLLCWFL